jgi:Flp pilus assembly protein TadG
MRLQHRSRRRGTILPQLCICLVILCAFVALAIDIGMVAVAKTQLQNAADVAACVGCRHIDGSANQDLSGATAAAQNAAIANPITSATLTAAEITVQHGAFHYDATAQTFTPNIPPVAPDNYNLTQVTITHNQPTVFGQVLGVSSFPVTATSIAAYRPHDIAIVLDYSGSMNNESDLWNNESYLGTANNSPNNTDLNVPQFGHYSSASATMVCTSTDPRVGRCNITMTVQGVPPLVNDYYQHSWGTTPVSAFTAAPNSYMNIPGGDNYMVKSGTSTTPPTYAQTIQDVTGATSTQITNKTDPPMPSYPNFAGYTMGPNYYGKTFFIWPPDPNSATPNDWRSKFFLMPGGSYPTFGGPVTDNTVLWDSAGNLKPPVTGATTNYVINYAAILQWIAQSPSPFPPRLRAGKIQYYGSIPTDVPAAAYNWNNYGSNITYASQDQRFWKEYIDYAIGVWRDPLGNLQTPGHPACSIGPDFTWGTVKISAPVSGYTTAPTTRMHPQDNPQRPRHRFWFGPLTMIQFISDTGMFPGTSHDVSMYPAKSGIAAALQDISNNHPNDLVSLLLFSRPHYSGEPAEVGRNSIPLTSLSRNYAGMLNAMYFPPNSSSGDVLLYSADGLNSPRAHGDYDANTATDYGFMLAYNQFSSNSALQAQYQAGTGRVGATRIVILETDGMANQGSQAGFTNNGAYKSYYNIGPTDTVTAGGTPSTQALAAATKICAQTTDTVNGPGFATPRKAVIIHCIAFGAIFEPTAAGAEATNAMAFLQQVSAIGGTGFPSSVTDTSSPYAYKLCTGTLSQRQAKLRTAFTTIMDQTVGISLVK